ncbi:hypothetical protein [Pelagicoccus sp. SDUM812002]|uniref:hypothetical protein n=1 Tax=Pelagicoccus sp. SDUM812002 TaxID=3041266 RepID=UPI00280DEBDD|nr:hypothetical protein [Pelagicoccus sp. SDUM812002]MDQ8184263.1 hypothetical protein [Pelagicoccus sp. SDUM812002]
MPSGMKLTMLVAECQPNTVLRLDEAFRELLENAKNRLRYDKVIRNLAHPDQPELTRSDSDSNVEELEHKIDDALDQLAVLDSVEGNNERSTRSAWDWVFKTDGYFREFDEKQARLEEKVGLINSGSASTSSIGVIVSAGGVDNQPHRFYGEDY